jgi:hypothetical protein
MGQLQVTPWRRYGHSRLYVHLPDGQSAAWFDLRTQQLTMLLETNRDAVLEALAPYLAQQSPPPVRPTPLASMPAEPQPTVPPAPPSPEPASAPAPLAGWTPEVPPLPAAPPPAPWPSLPPEALVQTDWALAPADDLAGNRPGAALRAKVEELTPGFWRSLLNRLLRRPSELEGWRKGLAGEETVGAELERLARRGWQVLHSIPLPRNVDIDHLLIGPGGVFTVNTKYHVGASIWVGDQAVKVGGQSYPYVRKARAEARRAAAVLGRACGFTVPVDGVLVFVLPAKLTVAPTGDNAQANAHTNAQAIRVHALRHTHLATFNQLPVVWQPDQVERIYAAARDRRNWLSA